jgi:hypothetical protein
VIGYIQEYLVNRFLKSINASRMVVLAVNTMLSFDAAYIIRTVLSYYGLTRFIDMVFWVALLA